MALRLLTLRLQASVIRLWASLIYRGPTEAEDRGPEAQGEEAECQTVLCVQVHGPLSGTPPLDPLPWIPLWIPAPLDPPWIPLWICLPAPLVWICLPAPLDLPPGPWIPLDPLVDLPPGSLGSALDPLMDLPPGSLGSASRLPCGSASRLPGAEQADATAES